MPKVPSQKLKPTVKPVKLGQEEDAPPLPPQQEQPVPVQEEQRVPSGISGLDELLGGGFEKSSINLVMGGTGSGKTTFLAQFLYNGTVQHDDPGVLLCFEETADAIMRHTKNFGFDFKTLEEKNLFSAINYRPHEVKKLVEEGGGLILDSITSLGAKRLAIDSLTSYMMLFDTPYQAREAEISLFELIKKWKCTSVLSAEAVGEKRKTTGGMEYLADSVIRLHHPRNQSSRYRALEVLKMRGGKQSEKLCPFELVEGAGVKVYPHEQVFYDVEEKGKDE